MHLICPGQVLCFPRPMEVPGAAHGPPEHGGLHWPDSGGLAYEVGRGRQQCPVQGMGTHKRRCERHV